MARAAALTSTTTSTESSTSSTSSTTSTTEVQEATAETYASVFSTLLSNGTNDGYALKKTMRLFGLPYQFRKEIDTRVEKVSETVGRKFIENIILEAPVVTIVPGKAKYLPGTKNKTGWSHAFVNAANGNLAELQNLAFSEESTVRYYDFQQSYTEYMKYVNIMCRTAATFLELTDEIDGTPLQSYDWRNYRWTGENYQSVAGKTLRAAVNRSKSVAKGMVSKIAEYGAEAANMVLNSFNSVTGTNFQLKYTTTNTDDDQDELADSLLQTCNFVQFYCDPDFNVSESGNNSTSESKMKGLFDNGSDMLKELAFITGTGGASSEDLQEFAGSSINALADALNVNSITDFFKRFIDLGTNVMKGENVIMPDIYNSSSYDKSYSITVHLKAPYGNRFSYYMDVLVPMFHLLALALPKQTSANTYGSPFLVKVYCQGIFTCNLGIVSSISINKGVSQDSWTNDGFPSEVDVTLSITDLYSDLTMSPQSSPLMFLANSSLIEYLATTCGLNLIEPQIATRLSLTVQTIKNAFGDIDENVLAEATDFIENLIAPWVYIS
jgi:hypothetical protein